ncbi:MAG TPA: hypothetical protein VH743_20025 [Beijerinckiaceae bacterium]|jgi:hypothetical protein
MHSIWFDIGLVLAGAAFATVVIGCFWQANRIDQQHADERRRAKLLGENAGQVAARK